MHVLYFILGAIAIALALGWRPSLDAARTIASGAWAGALSLAAGPWVTRKGSAKTDAELADKSKEAIGLLVVLASYGKAAMGLVGVVLVLISISIGSAAVGSMGAGLSPHDALDKAIRDFQVSVGLNGDGLFGPATVRAYYGRR